MVLAKGQHVKKFSIILLTLPLLMAQDCDSAEEMDRESVQRQQSQYVTAQPIPAFDWSLERDVAIQLYQARNEEVSTWTVWRANDGTILGDCPSIGYPLPYDTSLTNPLKRAYSHSSSGIIEQAEPNGLYSSKNSIATWVRCVIDGKQAPIYVEALVNTWPVALDVNYETNRATPVTGSKPSVTIQKTKEN